MWARRLAGVAAVMASWHVVLVVAARGGGAGVWQAVRRRMALVQESGQASVVLSRCPGALSVSSPCSPSYEVLALRLPCLLLLVGLPARRCRSLAGHRWAGDF